MPWSVSTCWTCGGPLNRKERELVLKALLLADVATSEQRDEMFRVWKLLNAEWAESLELGR